MYEPFRFQIEYATDTISSGVVGQDSGSHETDLEGRLLEGVIRMGQPIAVPAKDGAMLVSRVAVIIVAHKYAGSVSVGDEGPICLGLGRPAPIRKDIEYGVAEWFQSERPFDPLDLLRRHPKLYLHRISLTGPLCLDCFHCIINAPLVVETLKEMTLHSDPETVILANLALQSVERRRPILRPAVPRPKKQEQKSKRWWPF